MLGTSDDTTMTAHEIGNLRFLIEHQLDVIASLERQGRDSHAACDLLSKLMRRDEELRRRMSGPRSVASSDGAGSCPPRPCAMRFVPHAAAAIRRRPVPPAV